MSCSTDDEDIQVPIEYNTELNFNEAFSIQVDTLELDMTSSENANSIYITYSADNGLNENVLKYNPTTQVQSLLTHPDTSRARQIEITNNDVYSIASDGIYKFDLNFNNVVKINDINIPMACIRSTSVNDELLVLRSDKILKFNTISETYDYGLSTSPYEQIFDRDGELYNDNIYMFGGFTYINQPWPEDDIVNPSDAITVYNLETDTWSQNQTLPYSTFETFTVLSQNSIIIAGNRNLNLTNPFIGIYDITTNDYTEFNSTLLQNNISIRGMTLLNNEIYVAYVETMSSMPNLMTVKVAKAFIY
jgi:hypothetical protein